MGEENWGLYVKDKNSNYHAKIYFDVGVQFPEIRNKKTGNTSNICLQTENSYFGKVVSNSSHKIYISPVIFSIKILTLYLTKNGLKTIQSEIKQSQNKFMLVNYQFMHKETSTQKVAINEEIVFNTEHNYLVTSIDLFLQSIQCWTELGFYLRSAETSSKILVAKATVNFSEIFRYPHNKIYENIKVMFASDDQIFSNLFGSLSLCYQINADFETLELIIKYQNKYFLNNRESYIISSAKREISCSLADTGQTSKYSVTSTPESYKYVTVSSSIESGMVSATDEVKRSVSDYDVLRQKLLDNLQVDEMKKFGIGTINDTNEHLFKEDLKIIPVKTIKKNHSKIVDGSYDLYSNSIHSPESPNLNISTETPENIQKFSDQTTFNISDIITSDDSKLRTEDGSESSTVPSSRLKSSSPRVLIKESDDSLVDYTEGKNWRQRLEEQLSESNESDKKSMLKPSINKIPKVFTIIIHKLTLNKDSPVMRDANIKQIYIEYAFLGFDGEDMETPLSLPKPNRFDLKPLIYEFKREFFFESKSNISKLLCEKVLKKDVIKFLIISEPLSDASELTECEEIGFVDIGYHDLVCTELDVIRRDFIANYVKTDNIEIGYLTLSFLGVKVLREIVLKQYNSEISCYQD